MNLPAELDAAIVAAPDDREVYRVAGDWLEQAGSPQGELVALQLADRRADPNLGDRATALKHELLPPELRGETGTSIEWRWGFVHGVLASDPSVLRTLLASPIASYVQKIVLHGGSRLVDSLPPLRCVRTLMLFVDGMVDLGRVPSTLRRLVVRAKRTTGELDLPELLELAIDHDARASQIVAASALPKLERLQIDFGDIDNEASKRWLDPEYYPALRTLSLSNDRGYGIDAWRRAPIAEQLDLLDFVEIRPGVPAARRFIIDRRSRSDTAALLGMVGRMVGTLTAIEGSPFRVPVERRLEVHRFAHGYVMTGDFHLNGRNTQTSELRSLDEIAIRDHVFRFIEDDNARVVAEALRLRYGF